MSLLLIIISQSLFALTTGYLNLDQPNGWECEFIQGIYVCQGTEEPERKEAILFVIAAKASQWDKTENYLQYLKKPRKILGASEELIESKITFVHKRKLSEVEWVDSLQMNAELPGFWTRYLATTHQGLALLITYSISDEYYSKLSTQFEQMIHSIKLLEFSESNLPSVQGNMPEMGQKLGEIIEDRMKRNTAEVKKPVAKSSALTWVAIIVLIAVGYFIYRRRAKKSSS